MAGFDRAAAEANIAAMHREELERTLLQFSEKLHEGMEIVAGMDQQVRWLAKTGLLLCNQLSTLEPELSAECDAAAKEIRRVSGQEEPTEAAQAAGG